MIQSSKGVFLSYASEDAGVAKRICDALRSAGIEVWFDQSELRGGDAWDQKIRQQIRDCALFVPVISVHTQARPEGYFRLEWKLAVDRSHLMAAEKAFLVPVVADATTEPQALVPTQFRDVQWTRIRAGEVPAAFVDRIAALLNQPVASHVGSPERGVSRAPARRLPIVLTALSVAAILALVIATAMRGGWLSQKPVSKVEAGTTSAPVAPTPAAISEKSVAVLPFVNMSEDKNNEYFSDGLSEELIDMLTKIPELRVPARTSSFYFKGKQETVPDIAKALSVAHVLEGSVRKSGNHLRITAQLVRADNGYHLWSKTYDRKLDDIFKVQDEIAAAVVTALKLSLLEGGALRATPTSSTEAYTLYLQAQSIHNHALQLADAQRAVDYLQRALKLDPKFARAWATLAIYRVADWEFFTSGNYQDVRSEARYAAEQALKLDPKLSDAHVALSVVYSLEWNWKAAEVEIHEALALDPGNADAFGVATVIALTQGHFDEGLQLAQKAVLLDPLSASNYGGFAGLSAAHLASGRLAEAEAAYRQALDLAPTASQLHFLLGWALLAGHEPGAALAEMEKETDERYRDVGLALALDALGRKTEADRSLAVAKARYAGVVEYPIAVVYANRNDLDRAFAWVDRAFEVHDGWVYWVPFDPLLKNLRGDARYKALLRKMNLPE